MRLDLRFSTRPPGDLWCQAVAILVFQEPTMDKGVLSELNKQMSGFLTSFVERGLWTGEAGENFLLATQNMIKADKVLFHGMGPKTQFNEEILKKEAMGLGSSLDKIGISEFGISIPVVEGSEKRYGSYLELSVIDLVGVFYDRHKDDDDFLLKIIFSVERVFEGLLDSVIKELRNHFDGLLEFSIIADSRDRSKETKAAV